MVLFAALLVSALVSVGPCDVSAGRTVVNDVNDHRAGSSERALVIDPRLTQLAMDRGADLVRRHYFAHVSPDGTTAIDALRVRDVPFRYAGENLAEAETVGAAEAGLWASPDHRENIMESHYRRIGIAVFHTPDDGQVVVQIFTD